MNGNIKVVNKSSYKGDGIYIGRPSPLGNLWSHKPHAKAIIVADVATAINNYIGWFNDLPNDSIEKRIFFNLVKQYKRDGQLTLICWCKPEPCHGDFLANEVLKYC